MHFIYSKRGAVMRCECKLSEDYLCMFNKREFLNGAIETHAYILSYRNRLQNKWLPLVIYEHNAIIVIK